MLSKCLFRYIWDGYFITDYEDNPSEERVGPLTILKTRLKYSNNKSYFWKSHCDLACLKWNIIVQYLMPSKLKIIKMLSNYSIFNIVIAIFVFSLLLLFLYLV